MRKINIGKSTLKIYLTICSSLVFLLSSCSPEYIPNMVNSPMLFNKGEFQLNAAGGTSNFDMQTALAVSNHVGVMVNGSYGDETDESEDDYHKHSFIEGGIGYYDDFGVKGRYEIFAGYGKGKIKGYYEGNFFVDTKNYDIRLERFFIQPGIGLFSGVYEGSFSTRIAFIHMIPENQEIKDGTYAFLEPAFTSKVGYKWIKFIFQVGFSAPFRGQDIDFDYQSFMFNAGIHINLGRRYYYSN